MTKIPRPAPGEVPEYYASYVVQVPEGSILEILATQIGDTLALLAAAGEARGDHHYGPGKWTVKEVVGHVADTERVFAYRALRFARADPTPLPGFEQDEWVAAAGAGRRRLADLAAELERVRAATVALFEGFDREAWARAGTASGYRMPVAALAWIIAGHELHHRRLLRERYGL